MMPEFEDYEIGDEVIVHDVERTEDRENPEVFNAGWDCDMEKHIGESGTVEVIGDMHNRRPTYLVRFADCETWWWDPVYMERISERDEVSLSDEDFDAILN